MTNGAKQRLSGMAIGLGLVISVACSHNGKTRSVDAWTTSSPEVARIIRDDDVRIVSVDDTKVSGRWVEVRPGCRVVRVHYEQRIVKDKNADAMAKSPFLPNPALPGAPPPGGVSVGINVTPLLTQEADSVSSESSEYKTEHGTIRKSKTLNGAHHYESDAVFAVNFAPSHVYEVTATFTGDDIIPRMVEKNLAGERIGEHAAADAARTATCE